MSLPPSLAISPAGPLNASVRPPGSKSYTNRALVVAALAQGESTLSGALDSEDTQVMRESLGRLGIPVRWEPAAARVQVSGCGGCIPAAAADLYLANSGTSIRFLTALTALGRGRYRLDGNARMRERPIADLLAALSALGARCRSEHEDDCPPVIVESDGLVGGEVELPGSTSSQFLSAILMAAPYARHDVTVRVTAELVSKPYIEMTLAVMRAFGVHAERNAWNRFCVPAGQVYRGRDYEIEPDASAASYFFAAAAIAGGTVRVEGLGRGSLQGDLRFVDLLEKMGCRVERGERETMVSAPGDSLPPRREGRGWAGGRLRGIEADMADLSDTAPTLAAVALFAEGPTTIRGVAHMRTKETDRIRALAHELTRLGAEVVEQGGGLTIHPRPLHGATIETYDDHRMAMSLALVGLRIPGVVILNPACTVKTYPGFFEDLQRIASRLG